jgi:hypothetical protein
VRKIVAYLDAIECSSTRWQVSRQLRGVHAVHLKLDVCVLKTATELGKEIAEIEEEASIHAGFGDGCVRHIVSLQPAAEWVCIVHQGPLSRLLEKGPSTVSTMGNARKVHQHVRIGRVKFLCGTSKG